MRHRPASPNRTRLIIDQTLSGAGLIAIGAASTALHLIGDPPRRPFQLLWLAGARDAIVVLLAATTALCMLLVLGLLRRRLPPMLLLAAGAFLLLALTIFPDRLRAVATGVSGRLP
ncbi:MAG: hypothetical protein KF817_04780 [Phycisphaeraceae bacterium]|nr:hypothetical protein [Phycisphaeraceae bacterium]